MVSFEIGNKFFRVKNTQENLRIRENGTQQWYGRLDAGHILLVKGKYGISGEIRTDADVYKVSYFNDHYGYLLRSDIDYSDAETCTGALATSFDKFAAKSKGNNGTPDNKNLVVPIDVLLLYTPAAISANSDILQDVDVAVAQWDLAGRNSDIKSELRIVDSEHEIDFTENPNNSSQDLRDLRDNLFANELRNNTSADVVIVVTANVYPDIGGRAFFGPNNDGAFGIVEEDNIARTLTFIHEMGHLLGADHSQLDSSRLGDGHAHQWTGSDNMGYRSIMEVTTDTSTRLVYFSNPGVIHLSAPTGIVNSRNNVRLINQNDFTVSQFRTPDTSNDPVANILGPASAEDNDNLNFQGIASNGQSPYNYQWEVDNGTGYYNYGTGTSINYSMPVDEDLFVRLTVTDSNNDIATKVRFVRNLNENGGCNPCPDDEFTTENTSLENKSVVQLYPNPAGDIIFIENTNVLNSEDVSLFNPMGSKINVSITIDNKSSEDSRIRLDVSKLTYGLYTINLQFQKSVQTIQFFKK